MNIVILAGGSGSKAIATGIAEKYGNNVDVKVIINALDNGLSTGVCRQLSGDAILGPSDLRKNQMLWYGLQYGKDELYQIFDERFTKSPKDGLKHITKTVERIWLALLSKYKAQHIASTDSSLPAGYTVPESVKDAYTLLENAVADYVNGGCGEIEYDDFSMSNILYTALAVSNGDSLMAAGDIIEQLLEIKTEVILNSDENAYLKAKTGDGTILECEGDIVFWDNPDDPIESVFLTDSNGPDGKIITQKLCPRAKMAIEDADIIILSSGTQWSSLIPTYQTDGFAEAFKESTAKKFLVMNNTPDRDMMGLDVKAILKNINYAINLDDTYVVVNDDSKVPYDDNDIGVFSKEWIVLDVAEPNGLHDPARLIDVISEQCFTEDNISLLDSDLYIFDYDDTINARSQKGQLIASSSLNISILNELHDDVGVNVAICTGNGIHALKPFSKNIPIYADCGSNCYLADSEGNRYFAYHMDSNNMSTVLDRHTISKILEHLKRYDVDMSKVTIRGGVNVSIKPVDPKIRSTFSTMLNDIIRVSLGDRLVARNAGKTTVEICHKNLGKLSTVESITTPYINKTHKPVYIGDEFQEGGNDHPMLDAGFVHCLNVDDIKDTAFFLITLYKYRTENNFKI